MSGFEKGDRVTVVSPQPGDPIEIWLHRHAVVAEVLDGSDGPGYIVGHDRSHRRFGPYLAEHLAEGWVPIRM